MSFQASASTATYVHYTCIVIHIIVSIMACMYACVHSRIIKPSIILFVVLLVYTKFFAVHSQSRKFVICC